MSFEYDYHHWQDALARKPVDWPLNRAMPGFYRNRQRDGAMVGIAVWLSPDGRPVVKVAKGPARTLNTEVEEEEWAERHFAWCSGNPVSEQSYRQWLSTGTWPDDAPEIERDHNAAVEVQISESIADLKREAEAWLAEIGGTVQTQEHADRAANIADKFAELAKEAETTRTAEKKAILEQGREIDGKWKPIVDAGDKAKRWAKSLLDGFLKAERARRLAEASEAAAQGRAVRDTDVKVKAGTRGRSTSLRTRQEYRCTDAAALLAHYRDDPRFGVHPAVLTALADLSKHDLLAGQTVPGAHLELVETAA